jgi:hypothetical protein
MTRPAARTALLILAISCSRSKDAPSDQSGRTSSVQVSESGVGPLRAGMTLAQGEAALRTSLAAPAGMDSAQCRFVAWSGSPPGLRLMIENNVIVRVDVDSATIQTVQGARVGDTEDRIQSLYSGRVAVGPHKYTKGHYLTVTPADPADSAFRLIFETDGQRVVRYHAGKRPQVEYVEGCG